MASSSSSSSPDFSRPCPENGRYDVFLSFRGKDTRGGFTYNLYQSLMDSKVHTFMDVKLVGKTINSLFKIIEKSKMAVVIYSKRFASSDWCLKELDTILRLMKDEKMMMLPIFYKVKVDELKHLTGNTGKYLEEHISDHGQTNVQKWKTAVTTLGAISGLSYGENSYERIFITEVIKTVKDMLEEWKEPVESSIKPQYSGPSMELHNKTDLDFLRRFEEIETMLNRLYGKESTGNQQPYVLAKEENIQALLTDLQTSIPRKGVPAEFPVRSGEDVSFDASVSGEVSDDDEMDTALLWVEEEVLSSNDQQQQADEPQTSGPRKGVPAEFPVRSGKGSADVSFNASVSGEVSDDEMDTALLWVEEEQVLSSNDQQADVPQTSGPRKGVPAAFPVRSGEGLADGSFDASVSGEVSDDEMDTALLWVEEEVLSSNDQQSDVPQTSGPRKGVPAEFPVRSGEGLAHDSFDASVSGEVSDDEMDTALLWVEEEVLSSNDQQQQAHKVPQKYKCSSTGAEEVYRIVVNSPYFQKSYTKKTGELIVIRPSDLIFYVEPKKPSSSWLTLTNKTDNNVAFMLKMDTKKQLNYSINTNKGVLLPRSRCQVQVTMKAQTVLPSHEVEESKDTLLIQSVKAKKHSYSTNNFPNVFTQKYTMSVLYVAPPSGDSSVPKPLGQLLATKGLHHDCMCVNSIDTHPTKPWLLVAFHAGVVSIWNYETRAEEKSFRFDDWGQGYASFIHEKHWIAVGGNKQGFVLVFNYNTSEKVKEFKAHEDSLRCIKVHRTSPYVLTASDDKLVKLWNWENDWACSETFEGHSNYVMDVAFNPKDSRSFASASYDGTIKIWSFGSSIAKFTIKAHASRLTCVEYFVGNDNKLYLLSGSFDNTIRVWDYASKTLVQTLKGHSDVVKTTLVHPKLPIIITGSDDKTIRIWNKDTHRLKLVWTSDLGELNSIRFIQASDEVVIGCEQGMVVIKIVNAAGHDRRNYR